MTSRPATCSTRSRSRFGELVQREVGQPAVLQGADAVLGADPHPVPQLEIGDPPPTVLVANPVIRQPSWSVIRSCVRGADARGGR
jgi:hypothetical protein